MYGGPSLNAETVSDMSVLFQDNINRDVTSMKVCTDYAVTFVKGIQVSYGSFNGDGEIINSLNGNKIGDLDHNTALCTIFYIPRNQYLAQLILRYNDQGIVSVRPTTDQGKSASYGKQP